MDKDEQQGVSVNQGYYLALAHSGLLSALNNLKTAMPLDPAKYTPELFTRCENMIQDIEKSIAYFQIYILPDVMQR